MEFIFLFAVLPKICFSTSTFQDFCSDLFCSYLQRHFLSFTNFCSPENLLVAAANLFKVLKTFISLKVTVYIQDRRLRSEKPLDAQGFEWISNCTEMAKYTCDFKHKIYCNICIYSKTCPSSLLYIQQRHIQNPFQRLSKEVISLEVTIFTKNSILDV